MLRRATVCAAALVVVSCYPVLSGDDDDEPTGVLGHFEELVGATCAANERCCGEGPADKCASGQRLFIGGEMGVAGDYMRAVRKGRAAFDEDLAAECRRWVRRATCDEWKDWAAGAEPPDTCRRAARGTGKNGSPCASAAECESGFCDEARFPGEPPLEEAGICRARAGEGEPCRSRLIFDTAPCQRGFVCRSERPEASGVCERLRDEAEACEHLHQCWSVCDPGTKQCAAACGSSLYRPFEQF